METVTQSSADLTEQVRTRAAERCEYCCMHQSLQGATFHVEHAIPVSKGGATALDNLGWACPSCNLHKSDRVDSPDPDTGEHAHLFNPRSDRWADHFHWDGYRIEGRTATGRATIAALQLNGVRRRLIRQAEETLGLFPP